MGRVSAVILAGGYGKRLGKLTEKTPKPLLEVGGMSVLEDILFGLDGAGIKDFWVHLHYLPLKIMDALKYVPLRIYYFGHSKLPGTARAVWDCPSYQGDLLVHNGDTLTNLNYRKMILVHRESDADVTVFSPHNSITHTGGVYIFKEGLRWEEQPPRMLTAWIKQLRDSGKKIEIYNPPDAWYFDIGTPEKLKEARRFFADKKSNPVP